jgi:hypothetical protein
MPAYALLMLPAARAVAALSRPRLMRPLVAVALVAYFAVQSVTFAHWARYEQAGRGRDVAMAAGLRGLGLRTPCFVYGRHAVQVGYLGRCSSVGVFTRYGGARPPASVRAALARNVWVAVIGCRHTPPAAYLAGWKRVPLKVSPVKTWYVYLPPARR